MGKYVVKNMPVGKNRSKQPLKSKGGVLHETANAGGTAFEHYKYFNGEYRGASAHVFIDWKEIIVTVPLNEKAWHAGPTANCRYVGVEMCRPKTYDPVLFVEVWNRAVWWFAQYFVNDLKIHTVTADNLLSHDDCRIRYKDTTHTDPTALLREYGKIMEDFRRAVQEEINSMLGIKTTRKGSVVASVLNVRKAPATTAEKVGSLMKGDTVEVLEQKGEWYRIGEDRWVSVLYVTV